MHSQRLKYGNVEKLALIGVLVPEQKQTISVVQQKNSYLLPHHAYRHFLFFDQLLGILH